MTMDKLMGESKVIPFRIPTKSGKAADYARIVTLHLFGQITEEEREYWLKNGGHK